MVLLVCVVTGSVGAQSLRSASADSVVIKRNRILLHRSSGITKQYPEKKTAVVIYPTISGLRDAAVLRKIRSLLQLKNIFDYSLAEYRSDPWLEEFDYVVNYNKDYILDITFTQMGSAAYPDSQSKHLAINLKTGTLLKATDVFHAARFEELVGIVDKKLQAEVAELISETKKDPHQDEDQKQNIIDALKLQRFETKQLDDFSVGPKGLTFLYDAGFPHVIQALQPDGKYFFSYSELKPFIKPDGPLGQFVR